jgi:hypothetical protein
MIVPSYTTEDLKKLPLRAIVALAARCARRVESLSVLPDGHEHRDRCRTAIDGAIRLAEDFARASPCRDVPSVIQEVEACRAIAQGEFVRERACPIGAAGGHRARTPGGAGRVHGTPDAIQAVAPTGPEKPVTERAYEKPRRDLPLRFPIGMNPLYPLESRRWS